MSEKTDNNANKLEPFYEYNLRHHPTRGRNKFIDTESSIKYRYSELLMQQPELTFEEFLIEELKSLERELVSSSVALKGSREKQALERIKSEISAGPQEYENKEDFQYYKESLIDLKNFIETGKSKSNELNELFLIEFTFSKEDYQESLIRKSAAVNLLKQTNRKLYEQYESSKGSVMFSSRHKEFLLDKLLNNLELFKLQNNKEQYNILGAIIGVSGENIRKRPPFKPIKDSLLTENQKKTKQIIDEFWKKNTPKQ